MEQLSQQPNPEELQNRKRKADVDTYLAIGFAHPNIREVKTVNDDGTEITQEIRNGSTMPFISKEGDQRVMVVDNKGGSAMIAINPNYAALRKEYANAAQLTMNALSKGMGGYFSMEGDINTLTLPPGSAFTIINEPSLLESGWEFLRNAGEQARNDFEAKMDAMRAQGATPLPMDKLPKDPQ